MDFAIFVIFEFADKKPNWWLFSFVSDAFANVNLKYIAGWACTNLSMVCTNNIYVPIEHKSGFAIKIK